MIKNLIKIVSCMVVVLAVLSCKKNSSSPPPRVVERTTDPEYRELLARGVNLSNWFNDYSDPRQYGNRFTDAHFALLKEVGFTYVRIPVGQNVMFQPQNAGSLNSVNLDYVKEAVQKAVDHGLAVTINYHTASDDFEKTLITNKDNQKKLASYWKAVAAQFKSFSKTQIFFEVYNEPHVASNGSSPGATKLWWEPVQKMLIDAIRTETTDHFIIAGGEGWNSIEGLKLLKPYQEKNIIYNFHFYDPFFFTHQGATWSGPQIQKLRNLPYPSTPENVAPILDTATDADVIQYVTWYGDDKWDSARLDALIRQAHEWAVANDAAIICNEFGCYKPYSPREGRLAVIRDIRTILESYDIGWAMWEMDEGFGFIDYPGGDRNVFTIDEPVLQALGLE